jgi:saxitoxin biosynthesis operon SxtJ-like protein
LAGAHEDFSRTQPVKGSSNRAFGAVFTAVFLIVALWPLASGHSPRGWALAVSGLLLLITVATPSWLTVPNRLWMKFGLLLHRVISPVVLAILFYVVVTPMGLIMRAFGKDPLRLKREGSDPSYWIKREPPGPQPDSMSDQF